MDSLANLAQTTSFLTGASGLSVHDLEQRIPGYAGLSNFFQKWLKVDLTAVLTVATLISAISSSATTLQEAAYKAYWWIVKFLTASISIAGHDRLNREILNWLGAHVLTKKGTRILTANSETIRNEAWGYRQSQERNDYSHENRRPVQYLPTFGATWFIFQNNLFMVRRIITSQASVFAQNTPEQYNAAPEGDEPLVVICLGRSVQPIKRFLNVCREFADKQREEFVTVRMSNGSINYYDELWSTTILRPLRPLETVHFDEAVKETLVADVANYLDSNTRKFYNSRGIPYRRGFLFYGPPGTGKTSLSLALAGKFGLELYLVHMPSVHDDESLERLFTALPPRCVVLLEDIDAVGIKHRVSTCEDDSSSDDSDKEDDKDKHSDRHRSRSGCTLSGLLNVLDGVASQEGRIVVMTSNFAEKLDKALVRPGRVDREIYLGHVSQRSSELMFLRMYAPNPGNGPVLESQPTLKELPEPETERLAVNPSPNLKQLAEPHLERLAVEFSKAIPNETFTPAQLQGYLLNHRDSPVDALANIVPWVQGELEAIAAAEERAKQEVERKKRKRKERRQRKAAKLAETILDHGSDEDHEAPRQWAGRGGRAKQDAARTEGSGDKVEANGTPETATEPSEQPSGDGGFNGLRESGAEDSGVSNVVDGSREGGYAKETISSKGALASQREGKEMHVTVVEEGVLPSPSDER